jgi:DNA-binding response OmpR family regulator
MDSSRPQSLILVVDHEQAVLDEVGAILTAAGYACHCCQTADAAISTAEVIFPDLILCDINLHGANGVETCRRIQQNPLLAGVPLMFLSSVQTPDIIRRNDGNGGSYYLRKPLDGQILVDLIDKALSRCRLLAVGGTAV